MSRRALVTGISGFAGRHLARLLLDQGWEVTGTTHHHPSGVVGVTEHSLEIDDVVALTTLVRACRPTHVFHLAAIVDTVTTPDIMALYRTNTLGTAAVMEAVADVGGVERVVVASSAFAYGRPATRERYVREDDPLVPLTPYGSSKVAAEAIALQWGRARQVPVVVTRAFQHTGPGHVGAYALADWTRQLAEGATEIRVGNLDVARDYLDVRDVAAAYAALASEGRTDTVYNVGSGTPVSMRTLLDGLVTAFGSQAEVVVDPARFRPADTPVFVADVSRIHAETTWRQRLTLEQTLADLAAWAQTHAVPPGETASGQ